MGDSLLRGRSGIVTARAPGRQTIKGRDEIPVSSADQIDGLRNYSIAVRA